MTLGQMVRSLGAREDLNFLLTNRIPRRALTLFMGWFSRIELPWVRSASIALWKLFCDVDLRDAATADFRSLHHAFTRALRPGARPFDPSPDVVCSPSDGIVGSSGRIVSGLLLQAKGLDYRLDELLQDEALAARYRHGTYVTLRLTAGMYHRFHAPDTCHVRRINYISGDTWNVNPIALARIERLFCRNERAVIECDMPSGGQLLLVPVAAVLVASIQLNFVPVRLHLRFRGPNVIPCDAQLMRGAEMGWFEHGSTIIVIAPAGHTLAAGLQPGTMIRAGQRLLQRPPAR